MKPEDITTLVQIRIQQAEECLDDARSLISLGKGARTIINRTYYAAFYSVLALLQTQEKIPKKHIGVISLFDSEYVKTGIFPKDLSKWIHRLFDDRLEDDYKNVNPIPMDQAVTALEIATQFVKSIRSYLNESGILHLK